MDIPTTKSTASAASTPASTSASTTETTNASANTSGQASGQTTQQAATQPSASSTNSKTGQAPVPKKDALGIQLMSGNLLELPPSIILYGPPGSGKSTAMAQCFNDSIFIVSQPTVLRPLASWIRQKPDNPEAKPTPENQFPWTREGIRMPAMVYLPKYRPDNKTLVDPRAFFEAFVERYCKTLIEGTNPYKGIVIDEASEIADRAYDCIKTDPKYGKDNFAKINAIKAWLVWLGHLPRTTGHMFGFVTHAMEPKYDVKEGSPTQGQMTAMGGPKFPISTSAHDIGAMVDICLRVVVRESKEIGGTGHAERKFLTEAHPKWISKFRDMRIDPEETLDLRALLVRAEYNV